MPVSRSLINGRASTVTPSDALLLLGPHVSGSALPAAQRRERLGPNVAAVFNHQAELSRFVFGVSLQRNIAPLTAEQDFNGKRRQAQEPALKRRMPGLGVVGGVGGMYFYQELLRGADGIMTGFSFPEVLVDIFAHFMAGRRAEAARTFYQAARLLMYEFQPGTGLAIRIDAQFQAEIKDVPLFCDRWPQVTA